MALRAQKGPGRDSRSASMRRIFLRLRSALCRSTEPLFHSGRHAAIWQASSHNSWAVRCIRSAKLHSFIISSIAGPRQSRPSEGGPCAGGGGCIACDRNDVEECVCTCIVSRRSVRMVDRGCDWSAPRGERHEGGEGASRRAGLYSLRSPSQAGLGPSGNNPSRKRFGTPRRGHSGKGPAVIACRRRYHCPVPGCHF
jgi:hypothetical protein